MWCIWLKIFWGVDSWCWPSVGWPCLALSPTCQSSCDARPLLLAEHTMALQLLHLFMCCFLPLECSCPSSPHHELLFILHGPNISSSKAFSALPHSELPPPSLCTRPVQLSPSWVALVYPPDWRSLKAETGPPVAQYPQSLSQDVPTVSPHKTSRACALHIHSLPPLCTGKAFPPPFAPLLSWKNRAKESVCWIYTKV